MRTVHTMLADALSLHWHPTTNEKQSCPPKIENHAWKSETSLVAYKDTFSAAVVEQKNVKIKLRI